MKKAFCEMLFVAAASAASVAAHAGCGVTITGRYDTPVTWSNNSGADLLIDWEQSDVRVKLGTWATLSKRCGSVGFTRLAPGESFRIACTLDFSCEKDRRYRVKVCKATAGGGETICGAAESAWEYDPSPSGWTSKATVDLGDLGKKLQ